MKMICSILLLLSLTSCVSRASEVTVTMNFYQAEENHNITLEWMLSTRPHSSLYSLFILCYLFTELKASVLFHLINGVEDPEFQDEQFTGRVRLDEDVLSLTCSSCQFVCCSLSLSVSSTGAFGLNVKQTSYQAEENHDITLEWMFTPRTNSSPKSLNILCQLFTELKYLVLFHLYEGVEDPESLDEQFKGRVRWDKDVLRDGRIRLYMSRLRINDSGVYMCEVLTDDGSGSGICHLKVTAAADEPKPLRPTMSPPTEIWVWIGLYVLLTAVLCAGLYIAFRRYFT